MASVVKRAKSRFWTGCYTSRDGRQLKRSTKTTDKNQALEMAISWERLERRILDGTVTSVQIKKVVNDMTEKVTGESLIAQSTETYLNEWLKDISTRTAAATIERYKNSVKLFLSSIGDKAQKPVTCITPRDADCLRRTALDKPNSRVPLP